MAGEATVNIPKDVLAPIIQAQITAVLAEALGAQRNVLEMAVVAVLNGKVDSNLQPQNYGEPFHKVLIDKTMREAVAAAMKEAVGKHRDLVYNAVLKELTKKNSPWVKQLVKGMVESVFDPTKLGYRLDVKIEA